MGLLQRVINHGWIHASWKISTSRSSREYNNSYGSRSFTHIVFFGRSTHPDRPLDQQPISPHCVSQCVSPVLKPGGTPYETNDPGILQGPRKAQDRPKYGRWENGKSLPFCKGCASFLVRENGNALEATYPPGKTNLYSVGSLSFDDVHRRREKPTTLGTFIVLAATCWSGSRHDVGSLFEHSSPTFTNSGLRVHDDCHLSVSARQLIRRCRSPDRTLLMS